MSKKLSLLTSLVLIGSLVSPSLLSSSTANASPVENNIQNISPSFEIEYLENTDSYQKIKFTNKDTGEVEFLEVDLSKENPEYRATYKDEQTEQQTEVVITKEEDSIALENLTTNETKKEKIFNLEDNTIQPLALPGGNGDYQLYHTFKGSKSLSESGASTISLIAGIVASIYGGPVTGIVTSIATYLLTAGAPKFYYIHELYYYKGASAKNASFVRYYENSNYTGYINAVYNDFIYH